MVTIDWHRVACIVYFVTSKHIFFDEKSMYVTRHLTKSLNQWVTSVRWNSCWCTRSLRLGKKSCLHHWFVLTYLLTYLTFSFSQSVKISGYIMWLLEQAKMSVRLVPTCQRPSVPLCRSVVSEGRRHPLRRSQCAVGTEAARETSGRRGPASNPPAVRKHRLFVMFVCHCQQDYEIMNGFR